MVLSNLNHPFIVSLRFAFQTASLLFLGMDFLPGNNLGYYMEHNFEEFFTLKQIKNIFCEVLLALEELHRYNIIYRDLKPENIAFDCEGHIKLIDFGLVKINVKEKAKGADSFCGSYAYLAPEMIKKKGHGKAVDYYSLGIILYEMVTGRPPFYDENKELMEQNVLKGSLKIPNEIDENLKSLLLGLLERKVENRLGFKRGFPEIREHPWLKDVNWMKVFDRKLEMKKPDPCTV